MHIVFIISNESSVPYFNWFAKKAAEQNKHKFTFITLYTERPKMIEDVGQHGWDCYWFKFDDNKRKRGMISASIKLFWLFLKIKPDVVHSHLFDDAVPALFAARLANVPIRIITKADTTFHYFYAPKWIIADKFNNHNATNIIPPSKEAERFIIENENAPIKKISMIHHGIPPELFTNQMDSVKSMLTKKYELEGKKVIGTVARFIDWKGYKYIIKAIPYIIKDFPDVIFLFVGQGNQKAELELLVKELNVEKYVVFTGWIERNHIPSLYGLLNVYLHAANFEPFGFVIPEAMMNGAPVVSTPTGSALDAIKHKVNGYLVEYKSPKSIAEGVCYTLKNESEFKEKGRKTALEMYNFDLMYKNYIDLYEKQYKSDK